VLGRCGALINNVSCSQPSQCPPATWDKVRQCIAADFPGVFALGSGGLPSPASYGAGFLFDLWSAAGVKMMLDDLARHYVGEYGIQNFWLDCEEPCGGSSWTNDTVASSLDYNNKRWPAQLVGAAYPAQLSAVTVSGLRERGAAEPVLLARSSWAGGHRVSAMVWNGDRGSSFQEMQKCFRSALQAGLSGLYYWTTDGESSAAALPSRLQLTSDKEACCSQSGAMPVTPTIRRVTQPTPLAAVA